MLVTDRHRCRGRDLVALAVEAARGGARLVQLREKDLADPEYRALAERLLAGLPPGTRLLTNGRPELAAALGAGLHLPEEAPPPSPPVPHGRSVHGPATARRAVRDGAAWIVAGTVFPSPGKPPRLGLDGLARVCASARVPVYAIGGVRADSARAVLGAGAHGVAVCGAILEADDPRAAAEALLAALADVGASRGHLP